jgi:hypothetical protein
MSAAAKVLCPGSRSGSSVRKLAKRNTADTAPRFLTAAELMSPGAGVVLPLSFTLSAEVCRKATLSARLVSRGSLPE